MAETASAYHAAGCRSGSVPDHPCTGFPRQASGRSQVEIGASPPNFPQEFWLFPNSLVGRNKLTE